MSGSYTPSLERELQAPSAVLRAIAVVALAAVLALLGVSAAFLLPRSAAPPRTSFLAPAPTTTSPHAERALLNR